MISDVCQEYEVKGYPTFKYFHKGVLAEDYQGGRTEKDFVDYLKNPPSEGKQPEESGASSEKKDKEEL